jgi:hypothetical protein
MRNQNSALTLAVGTVADSGVLPAQRPIHEHRREEA